MNCEIQYARHACEYSEFFIRFASTMFIDGDKNELASFDKYLNMPAKNKLFANRSTLDSVCHPKVHAFELTYIHTAIYRAHIFSLLVSHRNHKKYNWIVLIKKKNDYRSNNSNTSRRCVLNFNFFHQAASLRLSTPIPLVSSFAIDVFFVRFCGVHKAAHGPILFAHNLSIEVDIVMDFLSVRFHFVASRCE